jgi:formylglycine-generating enzyme required for sulfatase activity
MKRFLLTALFVLIGSLAFAQERIAVFPFEDRSNVYTKDELDSFYVEFSNEFRNKTDDRRFTVLTRQDLEKIINMESRFQLSDYSSKEKTAEMQRVLNAGQVLYCLILKVGNEIRITVSRYTFPDLSLLRGGKTINVTNKNQLFGKIPELVLAMVNEIAGEGTLITPNFVHVEGGTFRMTSPNGSENMVTVKSFYISNYEVTQKEWQEVMGNNPSYFKGANLPVEQVSWYDALEYCNKRSVKEGLTPVYRGSGENITCDWDANGYRLPTEVEWEFAARGGTREYLKTEYSGSNSVGTVAWYQGNSGGKTQPVGTKAPNSLGIYDMSGNVWEWCWDWSELKPFHTETIIVKYGGAFSTDGVWVPGDIEDGYAISTDEVWVYEPGVIEDGERILGMWYKANSSLLNERLNSLKEQNFTHEDAVRYLLIAHYAGVDTPDNILIRNQGGPSVNHFIGLDSFAKMGVNLDEVLYLRKSIYGSNVNVSAESYSAFILMSPAFPGAYRVVRGGSWENSASDVRSTSQSIILPNPLDSASKIGFRLVRNVQ